MMTLRLLAALPLCLLLAACPARVSREALQMHNFTGQATLSVDNGTAGGPVTVSGARRATPVTERAAKGTSYAEALVQDWNTMRIKGEVRQDKPPAGPGAVPPPKIEMSGTASATGDFTLRTRNRPIDMKAELHWKATLKSGQATISVVGVIPNTPCRLTGGYALAVDPKDPSRINVTPAGGAGGGFSMPNGGGSQTRFVTAPQCTLGPGNYTVQWSVSLLVQGDPAAEVAVDRAELDLTGP